MSWTSNSIGENHDFRSKGREAAWRRLSRDVISCFDPERYSRLPYNHLYQAAYTTIHYDVGQSDWEKRLRRVVEQTTVTDLMSEIDSGPCTDRITPILLTAHAKKLGFLQIQMKHLFHYAIHVWYNDDEKQLDQIVSQSYIRGVRHVVIETLCRLMVASSHPRSPCTWNYLATFDAPFYSRLAAAKMTRHQQLFICWMLERHGLYSDLNRIVVLEVQRWAWRTLLLQE